MDNYRELRTRLREVLPSQPQTILQGIVRKVDGLTCEVEIGNITVPDVRLRATQASDTGHILITPKVGTAVIVGSLTGDLSELVVLAVDHAESVVINGGKLGGLINIETLTAKINELVQAFNYHLHNAPNGPTSTPLSPATPFNKADYEDSTIKH